MEYYATLDINYKPLLIPHLQIFLIVVNVSRYILVRKYQINAIEVSTFATKKFITGEISILFATIFSRRIRHFSKWYTSVIKSRRRIQRMRIRVDACTRWNPTRTQRPMLISR